jgi:hypothetical protein
MMKKSNVMIMLIVLGVFLLNLTPQASAAYTPASTQTYTIKGKAFSYGGVPQGNMPLECIANFPVPVDRENQQGPYIDCWYMQIASSETTTDYWGNYTCRFDFDYYNEGCSSDPSKRLIVIRPQAHIPAPEVSQATDFTSHLSATINVIYLPDVVSPSGQIYARRITDMTPYPIVHLEGFDPPDYIKSAADITCAIKGLNYKDMIGATELPGTLPNGNPNNALAHMMVNGYTFWMVMNGKSSGDSYRGTNESPGNNRYTDGLIYQAMTVVKQISDLHKAQFSNQYRGLILGGFSGGGLQARTGLLYWCNGYWSNASNYGPPGHANIDLPAGCYDVLGWYAGDSPLEGCMMPSSLQKFAYSDEFSNDNPMLKKMRIEMFENDYSAEVLMFTVPFYDDDNLSCNLGCNLDESGNLECYSTNWGDDGCPFSTSKFDPFMHWARGGYDYPNQDIPLRDGETEQPVPAVAWSHGAYDPGDDKGGYKFTENNTWFHINMHIESPILRNRHVYLHPNIAGASDENVNGSFYSQFIQLQDLEGKDGSKDFDIPVNSLALVVNIASLISGPAGLVVTFAGILFNLLNIKSNFYTTMHVTQEYLPTYMPTTSTLATNTIGLGYWNDYHWQDQNCAHIPSPSENPSVDGRTVTFPTVDPDANGGFGQTEIQMMFGFAHEQMKGTRSDSPICDEGYPNNGPRYHGKKASCRSGTTEECNCLDDNGDECVDGNMVNGVCEPIQNCPQRDFKVCTGVNNTCAPDCFNKECGDDGCGGYCGHSAGRCLIGDECFDGQCEAAYYSCAVQPSVESSCQQACTQNYRSYGGIKYSNCLKNCVMEECPGGGDDDGDIIYGPGIWDFNARSPETDDYHTSGLDHTDSPQTCIETPGGRDVAFIWRPSELRYKNVNISAWPMVHDGVMMIREGNCLEANEILCEDGGPLGGGQPRVDDFYTAAEQYCIIIDAWRGDAPDYDNETGVYSRGDIGQLRIWDAAKDEDCDNGQDDDGDGVADCEDWKCYGDTDCYLPNCIQNCFPHRWITAQNPEDNIWYYDDLSWRDENSIDPSCGTAGGYEGMMVWFPLYNGYWEIDTFGSNYDTVLWLRKSTMGSDIEIACNNDADGTQQSKVTIYAQKNEIYMIGVDTNGPGTPGSNVQVNATYLELDGGGCLGGLNNSWEFCQVACPCLDGQGDCDSDAECAAGLICGENNHPLGPIFFRNVDVCVDDPATSFSGGVVAYQNLQRPQQRGDIYQLNEFDSSRLIPYQKPSNLRAPDLKIDPKGDIILSQEICESSQCQGDFCNIECPCAEGEGDCDADDECASGLVCGQDNGPEWGCGQYIDICIDPANPDGPVEIPGGGCTGDLICGTDFCTSDCPCLEGQGDCDDIPNGSDCLGDLICQLDVGADFGCAADVDVCTVDPAISGGGCVNAARCQENFCNPSCPCNQGYGDCAEDADCAAGLVCAQDAGDNWGCPASTNICVVPSSDGGGCNGGAHCDSGFCRPECPCLEGEGDCLNDSQCATGLKCEANVGSSYGCDAWVNICVPGLKNCDPDYCSTSNLCTPGYGHCDSNAECESGLTCLQNVGADYGCDDPSVDICDLDPNATYGGCQGGSQCDAGFCDSACPCYEGQGECDTDADCAYILVCDVDSDNNAGCGSSADICMFPSASPCTTNAECDDSLFCNGEETCNSGTCVDGADPCPPGECNESTNSCETQPGGDIGYTTVGNETSTATDRRAQPVTATSAGDLQSVSIYHNGGSGGLLLAVYADDGGVPGTRLGVTPEVQISSSAGWETVNLSSTVSVSAGQVVWLAWLFESSPGTRCEDATPGRASSGVGWSGGMPADFGSSSISSWQFSIYATYSGGTCDPGCGTRECGADPNGCGTTCGSGCTGDQECNNGYCEDPPASGCTVISGGGLFEGNSGCLLRMDSNRRRYS